MALQIFQVDEAVNKEEVNALWDLIESLPTNGCLAKFLIHFVEQIERGSEVTIIISGGK